MTSKVKDIIGQKFGKLTVLEQADRTSRNFNYRWKCRCDCGRVVIVRGDNLRSGHSKQCKQCAWDAKKKVNRVGMEWK